eukprot:m.101972 g.101972  ORF g.101972 m.101972 type:complete len:324 (-) comp13215_c0_seq3:239-1210(-)
MQQQRALCAVTCYVLVLCTLSSNGAWVKPFQLQRTDRIGFVRPRKVASTTMMSFLTRDLGLCQSHCAPNTGVCSDCVLSFDCEPCEDLHVKYKDCVFCPHHALSKARALFSAQQAKMLHYGEPLGHFYAVTVIRDPVDKFLSYFFYVKGACPYRGSDENRALAMRNQAPINWLEALPSNQQEMICTGEIEPFIPLSHMHNEQSGLIYGAPYRLHSMEAESQCKAALARLHDFAAVIPYNYLGDGMKRMKNTFLIPPEVYTKQHDLDVAEGVAKDTFHSRPTSPDPLREQLSSNKTLRALIQSHNKCDMQLYALAQQLFLAKQD